MKYNLFTEVALAEDFPQYNLRKGDVATIVEHYEPSDEFSEAGYSLEVFDALGDTITILTVNESQIQPLIHNAVFSLRPLSKVA